MKVSDVENDEMKACGDLINFFRVGEFTVKGSQSEELYRSISWLRSLAQMMLLSKTDKTETAVLPGGGNIKIHRAKK